MTPAAPAVSLAEQRRLTASAIRMTAMLNGGAVVVAGLYFGQELLVPLVLGATRESSLLAALRAEGGDAHLILSIGELLAYIKAVSAQAEPSLA